MMVILKLSDEIVRMWIPQNFTDCKLTSVQVKKLIPAWISNYMPGKVWDEIIYPFLNFNGCTVEV